MNDHMHSFTTTPLYYYCNLIPAPGRVYEYYSSPALGKLILCAVPETPHIYQEDSNPPGMVHYLLQY